ncbi:sensor histidine kinase [Granulicatella seriolae]|uniref:histidine kinase n=1 Tax=Granulicatella seriolae TaxID=2967226 RepID=A0ABT1WRD3_9LACT|nr:ATP-binding protein [Granulicatella seriolae]
MDVVVYYVISPQLTSLLRLNSVTLFIVYATYHIIQWRFEIREQKLASDITLFSDQKTNISYQLLSNEQFESMAKIISDVFLHSYEFTGIAFVWSENNNPPYFLFKKKSLVNLNHTFINNHNLFTDVDKKVINYKNEHVLVIPMMEINQVIGLIIVSKEKNKPFSQVELDELTKNAEEIAIFLRTSEQRLTVEKMLSTQYYSEFERAAYIRQHDLAQEDKKKLANYLHDNVLQTILAVKNLNLSIESNDLKTIELIDQTLKSLSVSMRDYMTQIYPSFLSVLPLENSFINLAKNLEIFYQLGIEINWHIEKNLPLTETQKVFFYRIVKELLTNAYKHSKANKIEVDLHQQDNNIILRVTDDGSGIKSNQLDDEQFYTTHLGLLSIKQEVDYKNGTLDIYSGRNIGTEIKISIPTARGTKS